MKVEMTPNTILRILFMGYSRRLQQCYLQQQYNPPLLEPLLQREKLRTTRAAQIGRLQQTIFVTRSFSLPWNHIFESKVSPLFLFQVKPLDEPLRLWVPLSCSPPDVVSSKDSLLSDPLPVGVFNDESLTHFIPSLISSRLTGV